MLIYADDNLLYFDSNFRLCRVSSGRLTVAGSFCF